MSAVRKLPSPEKAAQIAAHQAMRCAAVAVVSKIAYTVEEACEATGLSKTTIYEECANGHLEMGKLCGRTVIRAEELRRWFAARYELIQKRG